MLGWMIPESAIRETFPLPTPHEVVLEKAKFLFSVENAFGFLLHMIPSSSNTLFFQCFFIMLAKSLELVDKDGELRVIYKMERMAQIGLLLSK